MLKNHKHHKFFSKLKNYLNNLGVDYRILEHPRVYNALDLVKNLQQDVKEMTKSFLVKIDQDYYLIILPAKNKRVLQNLKRMLKHNKEHKVKLVKIPGEKVVEEVSKLKLGTKRVYRKFQEFKNNNSTKTR